MVKGLSLKWKWWH